MATTPDPKKVYAVKNPVKIEDSPAEEEELVTISVPPMWPEDEQGNKDFKVPKSAQAYDLKPFYIGDILYLNAQKQDYYLNYSLENPTLRVWILVRSTNVDDGTNYVKKRLIEEGRRQNIDVQLVCPKLVDLAVCRTGTKSILYTGRQLFLPDVCISRTGASIDYFSLAVIRQLEGLGCVVINGSDSIEISRDKLYTAQVLAAKGIPIPKTMLLMPPVDYAALERVIGNYPIIVKRKSGSKGDAVWKVDNRDECEKLVAQEGSDDPLIFQEFIAATKGRDLRVLTVGNQCVAAMMRVAAKGNYKANVHQGGAVYPIEIPPELEELCLTTAKLCKLDIGGIDLMLDTDSYKICEVNSSPGFEGLEHATRFNVGKAMIDFVIKHYNDIVTGDVCDMSLRTSALARATVQPRPVHPDHLKLGLEQKEAQHVRK